MILKKRSEHLNKKYIIRYERAYDMMLNVLKQIPSDLPRHI
ncbi:hypothetical protein LCGC14_1824950 [marine sediment metagenome]|uniref:Uncharacterized protein n=1 Tax=marine sediment metagenome TaxID=412755 RepID=A0A0F9GI02_9ZZZZ